MDFSSVTYLAIVVIAYLIGMAAKNIERIPNEWIPFICGVVGGVLGVVGMYTVPDFPAQNILTALEVGIVSGLAATGAHQVGKQASKSEVKENV